YRKAVEHGNANAQFSLGACYSYAEGVAEDAAEAVKWYRKAAEQGHGEAQRNLGSAYLHGAGVAKDYVEAYKWLNLAAAHGHEYARKNRDSLEQMMTPAQIAEGQRLSREFTPQRR
ncbi:MAG: tetratricopeptide repeat protein, partial [Verrucomicrobia bacterium]|nr:tetratricopeptide repeat protein [Verrucomicrobiota bacterium]